MGEGVPIVLSGKGILLTVWWAEELMCGGSGEDLLVLEGPRRPIPFSRWTFLAPPR